jgi:hypothetical protein
METPCNAIAMPKQYAGSPSVPYRQTPMMVQMMMPRTSQFVNVSASAPMPCRGVLRSSIVHLFRLAVARESQHARSFPSSLLSWTPRKSLDVVRPVVGRLTRVELQADAVLVLTSTTPAAPVAVGGRTWDRTVPILRAFTVASRRGGKETLRSRNGAGRGRRGGEVVVVRVVDGDVVLLKHVEVDRQAVQSHHKIGDVNMNLLLVLGCLARDLGCLVPGQGCLLLGQSCLDLGLTSLVLPCLVTGLLSIITRGAAVY